MDKQGALKKYFGHSVFREGQEDIIDCILSGRDALGIMPTGAGKSVCYQLPCIMTEGITLVVSPLISLMKDQVDSLRQSGVPAAFINSSLTARQQTEALRRASLGMYKIIYVAPERLLLGEFLDFARSADISMVTVDEAHCISQWGQDFRPSYLKIPRFISSLERRPVVSAFTATATSEVKDDIIRLLKMESPQVFTTSFDRPNLYFEVRKPRDKFETLSRILEARREQSGIVYCGTRKLVEEVCEKLCGNGFSARKYHAGLSKEERTESQNDFLYDRCSVMVATNAFGMGIDKSNVSYVIHYNMPKNLESYYQEAGRAGRDGSRADCILLYSGQDVILNRFLIENSREAAEDLTEEERLSVIEKDGERLRQMTYYATSKYCLRRSLLWYFGEDAPYSCGNCSVCLAQSADIDSIIPQFSEKKKDDGGIVGDSFEQKKKGLVSGVSEKDSELMSRLKALRLKISKERGIPAYVIFADAALADMCAKLPVSEEEFLEVSGVGAVKMQRYGAVFIKEINDYLAQKNG